MRLVPPQRLQQTAAQPPLTHPPARPPAAAAPPGTFHHLQQEVDALLVTHQRLLEARRQVQLHRPLHRLRPGSLQRGGAIAPRPRHGRRGADGDRAHDRHRHQAATPRAVPGGHSAHALRFPRLPGNRHGRGGRRTGLCLTVVLPPARD